MTADRERLLDRAQAIHDKARSEGRPLTDMDRQTIKTLLDGVRMDDEIAALGRQLKVGPENFEASGDGGSFYAAIRAAGYDRRTNAAVTIPFMAAASFSGDYGTAVRVDRPSAPLGADTRFLYPALRQAGVEPATTSIASFRQVSRTLADPTDMIRDIVAVSDKPETDTETELVSAELKQIATVQSGVPNIFLENDAFRDFIGFDLRFAYGTAVDAHVIAQIAAATPAEADAGGDLLEAILNAAELVADGGYSPSILAADPSHLLELTLLKQPGSGDYVFSGRQLDIGLRKVAVAGLLDPLVIDPDAVGVLHTSPITFKSFEENAGKTNTSLVRIESSGLFVVQRIAAVATVPVAS